MTKQEQEASDPLQMARRYAAILPAPSALFSSCIRTIKTAEAHDREESAALKDLAVSSSIFLIKVSPTLKSVFYKAAECLHPESLKALQPLKIRTLLATFHASEICAILALSYLHRHLKKKTPFEEFERIEEKLYAHMEISSIVGKTVRHMGNGNGILLGGVQLLAMALFSVADIKKYQEFRRRLSKKNKLFDLEDELKTFGCTHLQVASAIVQSLGFGKITAMAVALEVHGGAGDAIEEELLCWKAVVLLSQSFHETGEAPDVGEEDALYVPAQEAAKLAASCKHVLEKGSSFNWLKASKLDLTPEVREAMEIPMKGDKISGIEESDEGDEAH